MLRPRYATPRPCRSGLRAMWDSVPGCAGRRLRSGRGGGFILSTGEQCGFHNEVELEVRNQELVIRAPHHPRQTWEKAFQTMALHKDDTLLDADSGPQTTWDEDEWEWT